MGGGGGGERRVWTGRGDLGFPQKICKVYDVS